ncbi:MAG: two-component sensor histidine kinase, partial [Rubrivivax sp.]|nr:two-component sensor histidine kinase [Rubrivivax sp.]
MRSLTLRIYLTVLAALALFALASGWLMQRHLAAERAGWAHAAQERSAAWADLLQNSLPPDDAPAAEQAAALAEWSARLRLPLALDDAQGRRIGASASY